MGQYHTAINDYLEDCARHVLQQCLLDYVFTRNNQHNHGIDLKVTSQDDRFLCTIDVQYSMNFKKYGDLRIDLMSAGSLVQDSHRSVKDLNTQISHSTDAFKCFNSLFGINKYGKYLAPSNKHMLGIFYYFYHHSFDKTLDNFKKHKADFVFFLPKSVVLHELKNNPSLIIKINDKKKNHLNDTHHSAFICLDIQDIATKHHLPIFYDRTSFYQNFPTLFKSQLHSFLEMTDEQHTFI